MASVGDTAVGPSRDDIIATVKSQHGVIFSKPAIVCRGVYSGRNLLALNSHFSPELTDHRGYLPVEWWIMSQTPALNPIPKPGEGITQLHLLDGTQLTLTDAISLAADVIMGDYATLWPLTKVLDIGGQPVKPSFSDKEEVPPIPCHVHAGHVKDGCCCPPGKLEAYFIPPLNVPPYNKDLEGEVVIRYGLKQSVEQNELLVCLSQFGENDRIYQLMNVDFVRPFESWTIQPKMLHAPGPWLTLEIQTPQDDFNLLGWQLGQRFDSDEARLAAKKDTQLRGLTDEKALLDEAIDWDANKDPDFKKKWHTKCDILEEGEWGKKVQLFYHKFYGEGFIVNSGHKYVSAEDSRPRAGVVWSGEGTINMKHISHNDWNSREFLLTPNHEMTIDNSLGSIPLMVFTIFPMLP